MMLQIQLLKYSCLRSLIQESNALWIVQQMREAWPYVPAHRFLLFDHDSKFGTDVISAVRDLGSHPYPHWLSQSVAERCRGGAGSGVADETCWTT